ncbi:MAG: prolyl oligopeptidase family serine peptidase, partial [Clostridia bacterium]
VVCGFSAGGHLAGNISTQYNSPLVLSATNGVNVRPDAAILCYPLITFDKEFRHKGSFYCLCGNFNKKLKRSLSIEKIVTKDTPPMFIWHTKEDTCVPCQNSIMMAKALENNGIAHKLMLFPHGPHGLSLASPEAPVDKSFYFDDVAQWPNLAKEWLDTILK